MRILLIIILLFQGLTAFFSGIELIRTNGLGMPKEWLASTPFDSFLIPGIILVTIIGGTSLAAAYMLFKKHRLGEEASAVAGFGIQIWIFVQMYMIMQTSFLQVFYFTEGILILILSILLLKNRNK